MMRFINRSDSGASTASKQPSKRSTITRFFSNLSLSSRASRPDRPASVATYGATFPGHRNSEQIDRSRGLRGEHGLLGRASFDALSGRYGSRGKTRSRSINQSSAAVLEDSMLGPVFEIGHENNDIPAFKKSPLDMPSRTPSPTSDPFNLYHANSHLPLTPTPVTDSPTFDSPYSLMHISAPCTPAQTPRRSSAPSPSSRAATSTSAADGQLASRSIDDIRTSSPASRSSLSRLSASDSFDSRAETDAVCGKTTDHTPDSKPSSLIEAPVTLVTSAPSTSIALANSKSINIAPAWLLEDSLDHLFRNTPPSSPEPPSPTLEISKARVALTAQWQSQWFTPPGKSSTNTTTASNAPCLVLPPSSSPEDEAQIVTAHRRKLINRKAVPVDSANSSRSRASKDSFADSLYVRTPVTPEFPRVTKLGAPLTSCEIEQRTYVRNAALPLESSTLDTPNGALRYKYQPAGAPTFETPEPEIPDFAADFEQSVSEHDFDGDFEDDIDADWDGTFASEDIDFQGQSDDDDQLYDSFNSTTDTHGTMIVHSTPAHDPRQSIGGAIDRLLEDVEEWTMGTAVRVSPLRITHKARGQREERFLEDEEQLERSWEGGTSYSTPSPARTASDQSECHNAESSASDLDGRRDPRDP